MEKRVATLEEQVKTLGREMAESKREDKRLAEKIEEVRNESAKTEVLLETFVDQSKKNNDKLDKIGMELSKFTTAMIAFQERTEEKFEALDGKISSVDSKVDGVKKQLNVSEEKSKIDIRDIFKSRITKGLVGGGFIYGIVEGIKKIVELFH